MKKYLLLSALVGFFINTTAQTNKETDSVRQSLTNLPIVGSAAKGQTQEDVVRKAEDLKSGNYKDVLSSFFQLAAKDITGKEKAFAFNTTLFAIKLKANPKLLIDSNLVRQNFSRNFQFNFKVNLDSSYNFKGFTGGATYAIVNKRDRKTAKLSEDVNKLHQEFMDKIAQSSAKYMRDNLPINKAEIPAFMKELNAQMKNFNKTGKVDQLPALFVKQYGSTILNEASKLLTKADSVSKAEYAKIDQGLLWTVAVNGTTNKASKLNSGSINMAALKGDTWELDTRASLSYTDTVVTERISQVKFNGSIGVNVSLLKSGNKSLLEFKPYVEYKKILKGPLPGEKKEAFLANADLRIKITDQLWIPVTFKYDIKDSNFLGFLNVSLNMEAFK